MGGAQCKSKEAFISQEIWSKSLIPFLKEIKSAMEIKEFPGQNAF